MVSKFFWEPQKSGLVAHLEKPSDAVAIKCTTVSKLTNHNTFNGK